METAGHFAIARRKEVAEKAHMMFRQKSVCSAKLCGCNFLVNGIALQERNAQHLRTNNHEHGEMLGQTAREVQHRNQTASILRARSFFRSTSLKDTKQIHLLFSCLARTEAEFKVTTCMLLSALRRLYRDQKQESSAPSNTALEKPCLNKLSRQSIASPWQA